MTLLLARSNIRLPVTGRSRGFSGWTKRWERKKLARSFQARFKGRAKEW